MNNDTTRTANTFMGTTLRYLHDEEHRLIRQLEALEVQSRPYSKKVAEAMVDLAGQLAQLHWTESVLVLATNRMEDLPKQVGIAANSRLKSNSFCLIMDRAKDFRDGLAEYKYRQSQEEAKKKSEQ